MLVLVVFFLLNISATHTFGQGKALGIFSMTKKFGQMLGPLVIAWGLDLAV